MTTELVRVAAEPAAPASRLSPLPVLVERAGTLIPGTSVDPRAGTLIMAAGISIDPDAGTLIPGFAVDPRAGTLVPIGPGRARRS